MSPNFSLHHFDQAILVFLILCFQLMKTWSVSPALRLYHTTSLKSATSVQNFRNVNGPATKDIGAPQVNNNEAWCDPILTKCSTSAVRNKPKKVWFNNNLSSLLMIQSAIALAFHQVNGLPLYLISNNSQEFIQKAKSSYSCG